MALPTCFGSFYCLYRQLLSGAFFCKEQGAGIEAELLVEHGQDKEKRLVVNKHPMFND